jgi:hypothetical protein
MAKTKSSLQRRLPEMVNQNYAFVLDKEGKMLDPTKAKKAWYFIRTGKAKLVE